MAEAGFFYNSTCQRPDRTKPPSAHLNISIQSQAQPIQHNFRRPRSKSASKSAAAPEPPRTPRTKSSADQSAPRGRPSTAKASSSDEKGAYDRMFLPTPLPDYKQAANQTTKGRAQAQAAQAAAHANRKSSHSGGSGGSKSKHGVSAGEGSAAVAARGEAAGRSSSLSESTTASFASAATTTTSSEPAPSTGASSVSSFARRNGRRYLRDSSLPYPLPCDLTELHRQTLRTMLLCQVFNGPVCSPAFDTKPPKRVLEVGCGTGFWSVMCHRHFAQRGFNSISFTGLDIAPLAPRIDIDSDMNWRFVQHDLRRAPLPFRDDEFSLVMVKDVSMVTPNVTGVQQGLIDEYLRILKPGGTLEIWDGDHSLRMLLPHAPPTARDDSDDSEDEDQMHANAMGTYTITPQTPLVAPRNQYLTDYNSWIVKALEQRKLTPIPCIGYRPMLFQEIEDLEDIESRRLAIPLSEVRWEREGVGGNTMKGKGKELDRRLLTAGQAALRRTALLTVVQMIESLEPILREASGKGQDEWDRWQGNMMNDVLKSNGTSWGECLEVGAWWARKKKSPS